MKKSNPIKNISEILETRTDKKIKNQKYRNLLNSTKQGQISMTEKTKLNISDCGSFLKFISDKKLEKHKLVAADFCKNRFCPNCAYNKARKDALSFSLMTEYVKQQGFKFIFLTLTAPNIKANRLEQELRDYSNAFRLLFKRKEIKKINKGYIRKLELTYNAERDDYHPHYHVLIAVNSSYFTDKDYYLSRAKWLQFWQESKRDNTITQVDVRRFKDNHENETGILELTKYIAKDSNYLMSEEVFITFYQALKGKRFFSFNGIFKTARELCNNGNLDYLKNTDDTEYIYKMFSEWNKSHYCIEDYKLLTDEERERYNHQKINEIEIE